MTEELRAKLEQLLEDAVETYRMNGRTDYEAGVVQGIQRIIEALDSAGV